MSTSTRVSIDITTHAASAITASKRFAKRLLLHGYAWAGEEVLETVESGFRCCSNASRHSLKKGVVTFPDTADWTYFWAVEQDGDSFYCWFIERT